MKDRSEHYDKICSKCGGLVAKPGKTYGWGGEWCYCDEPETSDEVKIYKNYEN